MANIRLYQFPTKASPVPADIVYVGDSAAAFDEVQCTIAQLISAYPNLTSLAGLTPAAGDIMYTTASAFALLAAGTAGQMLRSAGAAPPVWSTATFPATAGTAGNVLISDGTNYVSSTSLWPNTVGSAGKIIRSDGTSNAYTTATFPDVATSTGSMLYANGTNWVASTSLWPNTVGSAGKIIRSDGTTNAYTTATFADTYAVSTLLYAASANAVSGLATANSAMLYTNSTGVPAWSASMTNGQIMIGSTGASPAPATLTAGPGISIANAGNSITISGTGSGIGWTEVTGTSQAMSADSGYIANNAGLVTLTLPVTAAVGTAISIIGKGAGGWAIAQNASQVVQIGSVGSTAGVGGSVASTNRYDSVNLICTTANTVWTTLGGVQGTLTIV